MTLYGYPRDVPQTPDETPEPEPDAGAAWAHIPPPRQGEEPAYAEVPADPVMTPWVAEPPSPSPWGPPVADEPRSEPELPPFQPINPPAGAPVEPLAEAQFGVAWPAGGTESGEPSEAGPVTPPATDVPTSVGPASVAPTSGADPAPPASPAASPAAWADIPIDIDDEPAIAPWDRKPLMVALAAVAALVLIGVVSGMASASYFNHGGPVWRTAAGPDPSPGPSPTAEPGIPGGAGETITLSGVGDVIMGTLPGKLPPKGGQGFFDPVKESLAADVVMGNLETPLTEDTGRVKCGMITPPATPTNPTPTPVRDPSCYQFYLPGSYANHLVDGGFDVVNLANNHTNDMGPNGLRNTRAALDAAGVKHTGAPNEITYIEAKGVKVAVLGFAVYSWGQNLNNIPAAKALVAKAAQNADLVVIQMQGGAEGADKSHVKPGHEFFVGEDRGDLIAFSHAVIDAGADVVFGHGPHIMRGMEFYKGRLIAYSLGNFCGYGVLSSNGYNGVGGVLRVTLKKDGTWVDGNLVPTEMIKGGLVAVDTDKRALGFVNGLSKSDFGARGAKIDTATGQIAAPVS